MRLFIAANFDAELRARLHKTASALRDAAPDVAWITAERLHLTLKFLGERDAELVPRLVAALHKLGEETHPVNVRLGSFGAFPNFRRARVVWMGIEPMDQLAALAGNVDTVCSALGIAREERPYRAHVTLGRVKRPLPAAVASRLERAAGERHELIPWHVGSVHIMHSTLGANGPTYVALASIVLAGTA